MGRQYVQVTRRGDSISVLSVTKYGAGRQSFVKFRPKLIQPISLIPFLPICLEKTKFE